MSLAPSRPVHEADVKLRQGLRQLSKVGRKLHCFDYFSQSSRAVEAVCWCLNRRELDLLFIDGGETFAGVQAGFQAVQAVRPRRRLRSLTSSTFLHALDKERSIRVAAPMFGGEV